MVGLEVEHHEFDAVLDECQFLTVGRELRAIALYCGRWKHHLLVDKGGVGKVLVFLAADGGSVDLPIAGALAGVGYGAIVVLPSKIFLSSCSVGNLLGGAVFNRRHKHLAARDKCQLLAIGRHYAFASGSGKAFYHVFLIEHEVDIHFLRCCAALLGVDFAIVGVAQCAVIGHREESHRMGGVIGHSLHFGGIVNVERIDIKRATTTFAEEIHGLAVGSQHRVAVFTATLGEVGVLACGHIVAPDVASHRRGVVLAPLVLKALAVVIEHGVAVAAEADIFGGSGEHLHGATAFYAHLIQFAQSTCREQSTLGGVLNYCAEIHILAVGRESCRHFSCRIGGQALGAASLRGHYIDIEVALTVACKSYLGAVGTPLWITLITVLRSQPYGCSACSCHFPDIAFIAESYFLAVRRYFCLTQPQRCGCRHG